MPIYEYQCINCSHQLEVLQKLADAPLIECPSCHADGLTRLVSATSFHLKGTGWYATDFKDKPRINQANDTAITPAPDTSGTAKAAETT